MKTKDKLPLRYQDLLFLYAYLRQADLSIDRCRWTSWRDLVEYYQTKMYPNDVMKYLMGEEFIDSVDWADVGIYKAEIRCGNLKYMVRRVLGSRYYLTRREALVLRDILNRFEHMLHADIQGYTKEVEGLRMDVAIFYSCVLEPGLKKVDANMAMHVDHYYQNESSKTVSIDEIISKHKS